MAKKKCKDCPRKGRYLVIDLNATKKPKKGAKIVKPLDEPPWCPPGCHCYPIGSGWVVDC